MAIRGRGLSPWCAVIKEQRLYITVFAHRKSSLARRLSEVRQMAIDLLLISSHALWWAWMAGEGVRMLVGLAPTRGFDLALPSQLFTLVSLLHSLRLSKQHEAHVEHTQARKLITSIKTH